MLFPSTYPGLQRRQNGCGLLQVPEQDRPGSCPGSPEGFPIQQQGKDGRSLEECPRLPHLQYHPALFGGPGLRGKKIRKHWGIVERLRNS
jgi:hypothetical protein